VWRIDEAHGRTLAPTIFGSIKQVQSPQTYVDPFIRPLCQNRVIPHDAVSIRKEQAVIGGSCRADEPPGFLPMFEDGIPIPSALL
jgi:hypothetical protein